LMEERASLSETASLGRLAPSGEAATSVRGRESPREHADAPAEPPDSDSHEPTTLPEAVVLSVMDT